MKSLKFAEPLPQKVLSGQKDTIWRIDDEKDIEEGDELSLCRKEGAEFARAVVPRVKETAFGDLGPEDRRGHESFENEQDMYDTYEQHYDRPVGPQTPAKVIRFELLDR